MKEDHWWMQEALKEAYKAQRLGEVPVGSVIVDEKGKLLATGHNKKEKECNPLLHAEVVAIGEASRVLNNWRLEGCTLYVTLEPCLLCLAGIQAARIRRVVFGAYDKKGGALSLGYAFHLDQRLNHRFCVTGGVEHFETSKLLSSFFKERRRKK